MTKFRPEQENAIHIDDGVVVTGTFNADGAVVIDGKLDGEITCGHLVVGTAGVVDGKIIVSSADIYGKVGPTISVRQLLMVRSSGRVEGNWNYGEIEVERGGILVGTAETTHVRSERNAPPKEETSERSKLQKPELTLIEDNKRVPSVAKRALGDRRGRK
jgi:cytoskeletal protein CcmA (bactofilin family)